METYENTMNETCENTMVDLNDGTIVNTMDDMAQQLENVNDDTNDGIAKVAVAAGVVLVAAGAAAVYGGKRIINAIKERRANKPKTDDKPAKTYIKLSWKERLTGKMETTVETEEETNEDEE